MTFEEFKKEFDEMLSKMTDEEVVTLFSCECNDCKGSGVIQICDEGYTYEILCHCNCSTETIMETKSKTLNGILCKHNVPVEEYECNSGILFLHNERDNLGYLIKDFSKHKKVAISYFVSDVQKNEDEIVMVYMEYLYGRVEVDIESSGNPYSEVTPDICWSHSNELKIGGHDLNSELSPHVGKWILIRMSILE